MSKAAQRARQFLERCDEGERATKSKNHNVDVNVTASDTEGGKSVKDGGVIGCSKQRARARGRGQVGGSMREEVDDNRRRAGSGQMRATPEGGRGALLKCGDGLGRALRLLVSGADTLVAWRREVSAKAKSRGGVRRKHGVSLGGGGDGNGEGDGGDSEGGVEEDRGGGRGGKGRVNAGGFGGALGKRRRSGARGRVRSRNRVIDDWLEEGGEEGGDRGDAFVDLEDFIDG